eukprot:55313_1
MPSLVFMFGSIPYNLSQLYISDSTPVSMFYTYRSIIELCASVLIIYDATSAGPAIMSFGSFSDRMALPKLAHWMGLGGHVGLATLRIFLYSVVIISGHLDRYGFLFYFKKISDGELTIFQAAYGSELICLAAMLYIVLAVFMFFAPTFHFDVELQHPWTASYQADPMTQCLSGAKWTSSAALVLILNVMFSTFLLTYYLTTVTEHTQQYWDLSFHQIASMVMICGTLGVIIVRTTYLAVRKLQSWDVSSSFLWCSWIVLYDICIIAIDFKDTISQDSMTILCWYFLGMLVINVAYLVVFYPWAVFNHVTYVLTFAAKREFYACVASFLACCLSPLAMLMAYQAIGQGWLYIEFELDDFILSLMDLVEIVFGVISDVLKVLTDVLDVLMMFMPPGAAMCIIIVTLIVLMLVLQILPFGLGLAPWASKLAMDILRSMTKMIRKAMGMRKSLKRVWDYVKKWKTVSSMFSKMPGILAVPFYVVMIFVIISLPAMLIGLFMLMFTTWERKSKKSPGVHMLVAILMIVIQGAMLLMVAGIDYMFNIELDIVILRITFARGWGLLWTEGAYLVGLIGSACFLMSVCLGVRRHQEETAVHKPCCEFVGCYCPCCPPNKSGNNDCCMPHDDPDDQDENWFGKCCARCCTCLVTRPKTSGKAKQFGADMSAGSTHLLEAGDEHAKLIDYAAVSGRLNLKGEEIFDPPAESRSLCFQLCSGIFPWCCPNIMAPEESRPICDIAAEIYDRTVKCCCGAPYQGEEPVCAMKWDHIFQFTHPYDDDPDCCTRNHPCRCICCECIIDTTQNQACLDCPTKFGTLFSYLIPVTFVAFAFYLFVYAIQGPWLEFGSTPDKGLEFVLADDTADSSEGAIGNQEDDQAFTCPITDLAAIIGNIIYEFLKLLLKPFFDLIESIFKFKGMCDAIKSFFDFVKFVTRLIVCCPGIIAGVMIVAGSFASNFIKVLTRVLVALVAISCVMPGFILVISLPAFVENILKLVPFIVIHMQVLPAYYAALQAYCAVVMAICLLFVDHVAPPLAPIKPLDFDLDVQDVIDSRTDSIQINKYLDEAGLKIKDEFANFIQISNKDKFHSAIDYSDDD